MKYTLTIQADRPDQLVSILNLLPASNEGILAADDVVLAPVIKPELPDLDTKPTPKPKTRKRVTTKRKRATAAKPATPETTPTPPAPKPKAVTAPEPAPEIDSSQLFTQLVKHNVKRARKLLTDHGLTRFSDASGEQLETLTLEAAQILAE